MKIIPQSRSTRTFLLAAAIIVGGGVSYYPVLNWWALTTAKSLCESTGPFRVIDGSRWATLGTKSQKDRFEHPGVYTLEFPNPSYHPVPPTGRVIISKGIGYNLGHPVLELHNPLFRPKNVFSDLGLQANFVTYNCIRSRPSKAREILYAF